MDQRDDGVDPFWSPYAVWELLDLWAGRKTYDGVVGSSGQNGQTAGS
jgi:hypothetical protein